MLRFSRGLRTALPACPCQRLTPRTLATIAPVLVPPRVASGPHALRAHGSVYSVSASGRVWDGVRAAPGTEWRTRQFSTTPSAAGEGPTAEPPVKKTELKKKKTGAAEPSTAAAAGSERAPTAAGPRILSLTRKLIDLPTTVATKTYAFFRLMIMEPRTFAAKARESWGHIKAELYHYWLGSKLLWQDMKTSTVLVSRVLQGHVLTRRERQQLLKTSADMFRLVPFAVIVIVPFMELLLPVALKLFPNMLPSTFETASKKEQDFKKQLQLRMDMAVFLQDTVQEMAKAMLKQNPSTSEKGVKDLLGLIEDVRSGKPLPNEAIVSCAKLFNDEITLDNISRAQLVGMSRYMGLNPYGTDALLRFQLRAKIRDIKADDQMILWEGIDSLTMEELRKACADRGMRATGLTEAGYRRQLRQWLDLSINKSVPASLLILSRAFTITSKVDAERAIQDSISALDEEVLTEAVLASASVTKAEEGVLREMKLESIEYQNELIEAEREEAVPAAPAAAPVAAIIAPATEPLAAVAAPVLPPVSEAAVLEAQKDLLDKVKATRLKMEGKVLLSKGRIKQAEEAAAASTVNKPLAAVTKKLDRLLKAIEDDLDKADEELEGKKRAQETVAEPSTLEKSQVLHAAVANILQNRNTDQAAADIVHFAGSSTGEVTEDDLKVFARLMSEPPVEGAPPAVAPEPATPSDSRASDTTSGTR